MALSDFCCVIRRFLSIVKEKSGIQIGGFEMSKIFIVLGFLCFCAQPVMAMEEEELLSPDKTPRPSTVEKAIKVGTEIVGMLSREQNTDFIMRLFDGIPARWESDEKVKDITKLFQELKDKVKYRQLQNEFDDLWKKLSDNEQKEVLAGLPKRGSSTEEEYSSEEEGGPRVEILEETRGTSLEGMSVDEIEQIKHKIIELDEEIMEFRSSLNFTPHSGEYQSKHDKYDELMRKLPEESRMAVNRTLREIRTESRQEIPYVRHHRSRKQIKPFDGSQDDCGVQPTKSSWKRPAQVITSAIIVAAAVALSIAAYKGLKWWQKRQINKALAGYDKTFETLSDEHKVLIMAAYKKNNKKMQDFIAQQGAAIIDDPAHAWVLPAMTKLYFKVTEPSDEQIMELREVIVPVLSTEAA